MSPVDSIELVTNSDGPAAAIAAGDADWAVLGADDDSTGLPGDLIRQPLDLKVAVAARMFDEDERLGVLGALQPSLLANSLRDVSARRFPNVAGPGEAPASSGARRPHGDARTARRGDGLSAPGSRDHR